MNKTVRTCVDKFAGAAVKCFRSTFSFSIIREIEYQFRYQTKILVYSTSRRCQRVKSARCILIRYPLSHVVVEKRSDENQADLDVNETFSKTALLFETSIHLDSQRYKKVNLTLNHNDGTVVSYLDIIMKILN